MHANAAPRRKVGRLAISISWLPLIFAATGAGLLLVGLADREGRMDGPLSLPDFWAGILLMVVPATWRLLSREPTRNERICIALILGLALFIVKIMASPLSLTLPDEFSHWRTFEDILSTGHLLAPNPLLPISSVFPGMEAAAAAASASSGLGIFPLAIILVGAARVVSILGLFVLAESVSGSSRVAGLALVIYMSNTSFLVFDAQFAYESFALPMAFVGIWAVLRWAREPKRSWFYGSLSIVTIATIATTHHLTSFVLVAFFVGWALLLLIRPHVARVRSIGARWPIMVAALWALVANAVWLATVGGAALDYLSGVAQAGVEESLAILMGAGSGRQLFVPHAGFTSPLPEIIVGYAAVLLVGLALPFMLLYGLRKRPSALVLALMIAAALYPPSVALRFTTAGFEASQRAAEFVFVGIGILGADWLVGRRPSRWRPTGRRAVVVMLIVVFAGGIISGNPPQGRLPGPYHVAAEQRSIDPLTLDTAAWTLTYLGPGNRIIADRTQGKVMGSLGAQFPVRFAGTPQVMFAPAITSIELNVLRREQIRYVVVDLRISRDLPVVNVYFDVTEPDAGQHTVPFPLPALEKFDGLDGVTRIYDSGDIVIYDVRGLVDAGL
jgi:hypothetical protein